MARAICKATNFQLKGGQYYIEGDGDDINIQVALT